MSSNAIAPTPITPSGGPIAPAPAPVRESGGPAGIDPLDAYRQHLPYLQLAGMLKSKGLLTADSSPDDAADLVKQYAIAKGADELTATRHAMRTKLALGGFTDTTPTPSGTSSLDPEAAVRDVFANVASAGTYLGHKLGLASEQDVAEQQRGKALLAAQNPAMATAAGFAPLLIPGGQAAALTAFGLQGAAEGGASAVERRANGEQVSRLQELMGAAGEGAINVAAPALGGRLVRLGGKLIPASVAERLAQAAPTVTGAGVAAAENSAMNAAQQTGTEASRMAAGDPNAELHQLDAALDPTMPLIGALGHGIPHMAERIQAAQEASRMQQIARAQEAARLGLPPQVYRPGDAPPIATSAKDYQQTAPPVQVGADVARVGKQLADVPGIEGVRTEAQKAIDLTRQGEDEALMAKLRNEQIDAMHALPDAPAPRTEAVGREADPPINAEALANQRTTSAQDLLDAHRQDALDAITAARQRGEIGKNAAGTLKASVDAEHQRRLQAVDWNGVADGRPLAPDLAAPFTLAGLPKHEVTDAQGDQAPTPAGRGDVPLPRPANQEVVPALTEQTQAIDPNGKPATIDTSKPVPLAGGVSPTGKVYIDPRMPRNLTMDNGTVVDVHRAIAEHELGELPGLQNPGETYPQAHNNRANVRENK